ncbi:hypothetical protein [Sphingomonas sp. S2-65]|uniref:hypothetical protein n=1 Tax=Sphingomonas sp. S2-65 TaxID=2903960 RepID=UPI001F2AA81A|nr:hypothetical protein [Sphingomonas sp. S2-65]UYY59456.1 hypothetical protein LZ586_05045 [Sphingomonas sp. S2-65]
MHGDFESQAWAENRHHLVRSLTNFFDKLAYAFKRLQAIEYDAPWERVRED